MKGLSIIIPVHNEEKIIVRNTKRLIDFINKYFKNYEIILCDNGSTDFTPEKGKLIARTYKKVRFFRIEKKALGLALKELIKKSRYERIIFLPIDLSVDLKFIQDAMLLLNKYDIVIGSKKVKGAKDNRPLTRKLYSFLFNCLVNLLFNLEIKDTQCVKAFKKSKIKNINEKIESENLFFDVELLARAKKERLKMIEIPVWCKDYRKSKFKIFGESFRILLKTISFWKNYKF